MTREQLLALGLAFEAYLRQFADCFGQQRSRDHLLAYCRGLLSDLPRKSVEPIALDAGIAVRTLQEFLKNSHWDHARLLDQLQSRLAVSPCLGRADDLGLGGLIGETAFAKKGDKTPGVEWQRSRSLGRTDNCVVAVHLALAKGAFETLADAELYLPRSWSCDRCRCREAGIPDEVVYRAKWRIALEQFDRARANGLQLDWLTFDHDYGGKAGFLQGLDERGQVYVGEVPRSFRCLPRLRRQPPSAGVKGQRVDELDRLSTRRGGLTARLTLQGQERYIRAAQVYLVRGGRPTARTYWLITARDVGTWKEAKYFVSNAPQADVSLERLWQMAYRRRNVENGIRTLSSSVGLAHYEGRNYKGLMRHLILCLLVMAFVAQQPAQGEGGVG
jgi:SRSO17 transposase